MPQLNPSPWFPIMILSWITLFLLFNPKITATLPQNQPISYNLTSQKTTSWNWPWI